MRRKQRQQRRRWCRVKKNHPHVATQPFLRPRHGLNGRRKQSKIIRHYDMYSDTSFSLYRSPLSLPLNSCTRSVSISALFITFHFNWIADRHGPHNTHTHTHTHPHCVFSIPPHSSLHLPTFGQHISARGHGWVPFQVDSMYNTSPIISTLNHRVASKFLAASYFRAI